MRIAIITLLACSTALAVGTAHWAHTSEADFKNGTFDNVRVTSPAGWNNADIVIAPTAEGMEDAGYIVQPRSWINRVPTAFEDLSLGTIGSYGWGSAYFPEYIVDPKERLVILFMTQLRPSGGSNFNHLIKRLTYQALIK